MNIFGETAWGDKGVYMFDRVFQQAGIPPPLRRSFVHQATSEAMRLRARRAVKSEEGVGRTHEPVFEQRIELDALAIVYDFGTEQGNGVLMDNIKTLFEYLQEAVRFE